jgi:hypothetical protein
MPANQPPQPDRHPCCVFESFSSARGAIRQRCITWLPDPQEAFVDQESKMAYLGYRAYPWTVRPTAALVAEYERRFGLRLPPAYRRFLLRFGGYYGDARCPLQEPAPYEDPVDVGLFMGFWPPGNERSDIRGHTEGLRRFAPPVFVPVMLAWGNSCVVAIKCSGSDVGHVYLFDDAGQAELKKIPVRPAEVPTHLQHRYTTMERYFKLRRAGRLPPKPDNEIIVAPSGLQTVLFRLATSFDEFLDALQRYGVPGGGWPWGQTRHSGLEAERCAAADRPRE